MEKTLLLAGKNGPDMSELAECFSFKERKIVLTKDEPEIDIESLPEKKLTIAEKKAVQALNDEQKEKEAQTGTVTIEWNKSSSLSSRSLVLQAESIFGSLDECILYFDQEYFARQAQVMDAQEVSRCIEELYAGFQFMALEIISRFEKTKENTPGTLVFLLKEGPDVYNVLQSPSLRNGVHQISTPLVAAASSAFATFAQNIAASYGDSQFINIILVRGDQSNDFFASDKALGNWLRDYIDTISSQKKAGAKKASQWIKAGTKASSPINILGKFIK